MKIVGWIYDSVKITLELSIDYRNIGNIVIGFVLIIVYPSDTYCYMCLFEVYYLYTVY